MNIYISPLKASVQTTSTPSDSRRMHHFVSALFALGKQHKLCLADVISCAPVLTAVMFDKQSQSW